MAEALFNAYAGGEAAAESAGIEPVKALNIAVVAAMRESGYDISAAEPKVVTDEMIDGADRIVTIGCADEDGCPPELAGEDWDVADPAGAPMPRVREIRDDVARRVRRLLRDMDIEPIR